MSTLVLHKPTDTKYILIGTGYETHEKLNYLEPYLGSLHIHHDHGNKEMISVCDKDGNISFFPKEELIVLKIDGLSPSELIV